MSQEMYLLVDFIYVCMYFLKKINVLGQPNELWYFQGCKFGDEGVEVLC